MTASPCRWTRETHPEKTPARALPAARAANSSEKTMPPEGGPPKVSVAICGNTALGMPKTMAMTSMSNETMTTVFVPR